MARDSITGEGLPCPFCGWDGHIESVLRDGYDQWPDDPDARAYWVSCRCCACHGPWMKSPTAAITFWNMRSSVSEPAEERPAKLAHSICADY